MTAADLDLTTARLTRDPGDLGHSPLAKEHVDHPLGLGTV